jgi:4a-hydroxytetrahydrobiopterin dehydratase
MRLMYARGGARRKISQPRARRISAPVCPVKCSVEGAMEESTEKAYTETEVKQRLAAELPHWYYEDGWIRRKYRTAGWKATLMVVNTVGHLAEAAWHHPDLTVSYAFVIVKLITHTAKGITDKDFALAAKIEEVVQWQPGKDGGALEGTPNEDARFKYIKYD